MNIPSLEERTTTVSTIEAARKLGLKESTLRNYRYLNRGPRYVRVGNRIRYRLIDLADWLEERTHGGAIDRPADEAV